MRGVQRRPVDIEGPFLPALEDFATLGEDSAWRSGEARIEVPVGVSTVSSVLQTPGGVTTGAVSEFVDSSETAPSSTAEAHISDNETTRGDVMTQIRVDATYREKRDPQAFDSLQ